MMKVDKMHFSQRAVYLRWDRLR